MQDPSSQKMHEYRTRNQSSTIFGHSSIEQKGAEKICFGNVSSRKPAPDCIPKLSLESLIGHDDLTYSKVHKVIEFPVSNDRSIVNDRSWQVKQTLCSEKEANFSQTKHDDVPDLELNLSQSNDALGNLAIAAKKVKDDLAIEYLKNKLAYDKMKEERLSKSNVVEESIINNQLNCFKVEDEKPPTELPKFGFNEKFDSRSKRHQDMYRSQAVLQNPEDDTSKRIRFNARIISIDGQNARREINGIFFVSDKSLTMYEFRQFGNRSNALPLIQRGRYNHLKGCLKGELYCLFDICIGKDLLFETSLQATLPDSLKKRSIAVFRITDVDEESKKKYLYDGKKRNEIEQDMISYEMESVDEKIKIACKIRAKICKQLLTRGPKTLVNLHHHFKLTDKLRVGLLNQVEVKAALSKFRIIINDEEFEDLWRITDLYQDNRVDFLDFSRAFIGEMSETRKYWVRKAFSKIDANRSGCGKLSDIKKFYLPQNSPTVKGNISETNLIDDLTQDSKLGNEDYVAYSLFEAYYEGVNLRIDADEEFIRLIRSCWTI